MRIHLSLNRILSLAFLLEAFCFLFLFPSYSGAVEKKAGNSTITSDTMEYIAPESKYVAKGSVLISRDGETLRADEIIYYEESSVAIATGNVRYNGEGFSITASRGEVNLDEKTGLLYDAELFYKKDHYYLKGKVIERRGEDYYYSPEASFTTCDAPVPAWCFKGKKVDAKIGKSLTAHDTTLRVKDLPVFYAPYLWTSILTERQTGFLRPVIGSSTQRGFELQVPFYWAISPSMDATAVIDEYTKSGLGTGLEYRMVAPGGVSSRWWIYHIDDSVTDKSFWEVKALHDQRSPDKTGGYLSIDYVNEKDFYREFGSHFQDRSKRFLQSTGEVDIPFSDSRLYGLSQYWVDLKNQTEDVPQRLPELGYVMNYTPLGSFLLSASMDATNFWRDGGLSAGRADVYPRLLHSVGTDYVLSQAVGLRGTAYSYYGDTANSEDSTGRAAFEYQAVGHTSLFKQYGSFTHVIEPSIGYHFISSSKNDLPVFDSTETFGKTSLIELSLLNRGIVKGNELFDVRLTQQIDTYKGDHPFLPFQLEAMTNYPFPLVLKATYDFNKGTVEDVTSALAVQFLGIALSAGQEYVRSANTMMYTAGASFSPLKSIHMTGQLWYDAKGEGLQELSLTTLYMRQCWGLKFEATKRPGDFSMKMMVELAGLNSKPSQMTTPDFLSNFHPSQ